MISVTELSHQRLFLSLFVLPTGPKISRGRPSVNVDAPMELANQVFL